MHIFITNEIVGKTVYYLPCHYTQNTSLCISTELEKDKMNIHNFTFIILSSFLGTNLFCAADKNETLSLTNDSANVTSSEVSAALLEHINSSGKFLPLFNSFSYYCLNFFALLF